MKSEIALVSSLPPSKCGVGTYAAEHLKHLHLHTPDATTCSPLADSDATHNFTLSTLGGVFKWYLFWRRAGFSSVYLHYVDGHYFPRPRSSWNRFLVRLLQSEALRQIALRSKDSNLIIHEMRYGAGLPAIFRWLRSRSLASFGEISFHTETMRTDCEKIYPAIKTSRIRIIDHTQFMRRKFSGSKSEARDELFISPEKVIFLCMGFILPSKGYQDAVEAFRIANLNDKAELHVVGSLQAETASGREFADHLAAQCEQVPGAILHEKFLSDEDFDRWLAAADALILPYTGIISSGVGARASLYGTPVIIRSLPNLSDQFPGSLLFRDVNDLSEVMKRFAFS